jgi:DNA-binding transcriptional LysR family regulator
LVDLGVMLKPIGNEHFSSDPLWIATCLMALSESHPLATKCSIQINDLGGQPVIIGQQDCGFLYGRLVAGLLKAMAITEHIAAEVHHIETALVIVQTGVGIAFVPAHRTTIPNVGTVLRRVELMPDTIDVQAVWATDDPSGLVTQFLRTARAIAASDQVGV